MGDPVQGSALGHAEVAHAETATILQLNERAAAQYVQAAIYSTH
jgi:hypothetical protein